MFTKFLVIGATGGTGIELVKFLIKSGKEVTILVKDTTKSKKVFKEEYEKISKVIEIELGLGKAINNEELKKSVRECDCLISTLGTSMGQNPKISDYDSIKELIEIGEQEKLKKFVFVTSLNITRPLTFVAWMLNNIIPFVLGWKALAENKLRLSKLNYMIVRPGQLVDKINSESIILI